MQWDSIALAVNGWGSWSSFPSDHALLFLALSVAILSVSRPLARWTPSSGGEAMAPPAVVRQP